MTASPGSWLDRRPAVLLPGVLVTVILTVMVVSVVAAAAFSQADAAEASDPLVSLPILPKPKSAAVLAPAELKTLDSGVLIGEGQVVLTGSIIIDQGPVDGMEVFACMRNGKTHESVVRLTGESGRVIAAAFITILGLPAPGSEQSGQWAPENSGQPARGTPLQVMVQWEDPDKKGSWLQVDASCLVRDRANDQSYPPLPFIYTGSRYLTIEVSNANGQPVKVERFMLDSTKSLMDIYDESDALLASPFPGAGMDKHFEANSDICPPVGTQIRLVFTKPTLPLKVTMSADGQVHATPDEPALTDEQLTQLLVAHYATTAKPSLRAVGVAVERSVERTKDVLLRSRIMSLAAAAKVWVVPVYILSDH